MVDSELNLEGSAQPVEGDISSAEGIVQSINENQIGNVDLSAVNFSDVDSDSAVDVQQIDVEQSEQISGVNDFNGASLESMVGDLDLGNADQINTIDQNVFTDTNAPKKQIDRDEKFGVYLKMFFISSIVTLLSVIFIALAFLFNKYIKAASQNVVPVDEVEFVNKYKDSFGIVKNWLGVNNAENYSVPNSESENFESDVYNIINAMDVDYIDKKDLLNSPISNLVHTAENNATEIENLKQEIARQGFLPEEVKGILEDNQAIETIQRSMNALEVIKFSTAAKVFSYMSSTLSNIAEMVKMSGVNGSVVGDFLTQITARGEKDINAYVNMCYLNPFEYDANCDVIGDLDLYYKSILKDESIDLNLLKNVMNGMNQLLENEDSATFSITFNGFNAQDKDITFNIEVFTNASDERALMAQGKKNPNIFILTNIVNLLKQSTFIIGAKIDMNSIDVSERTLTHGGFSTVVNYSSQDFTVPIQKDTEREIFDYIDINKVMEILDKLKENLEESEVVDDNNPVNEGVSENSEIIEDIEMPGNGEEKLEIINDEFDKDSAEESTYIESQTVSESQENMGEDVGVDEGASIEDVSNLEKSDLQTDVE